MKGQWKGFVAGLTVATLVFGLGAPALADTVRQISASYNGIKITLDGKELVPTDANGAVVEPFSVDGTTYLPVRAVADALGLGVQWDGETQTVKLSGGYAQTNSPIQESDDTLTKKLYKDSNLQIRFVGAYKFDTLFSTGQEMPAGYGNMVYFDVINYTKSNISVQFKNITLNGAKGDMDTFVAASGNNNSRVMAYFDSEKPLPETVSEVHGSATVTIDGKQYSFDF